MKIGIDASRAFLSKRTGIEEYSYQVIRHLREALREETEVVLYMRPGQGADFSLPKNWHIKRLWSPRLWTQGRLSLEMLFSAPDVLFIPAHTVPLIHPKKTVVTIHGLEYEFCREGYSLLERLYMRLSIRYSCWVASRIIAVSENTKHDLKELYRVPAEKIQVIPEGYEEELRKNSPDIAKRERPYFLFIGRLETRKNIIRIVEAFERFKEKETNEYQLLLIGKFGYGREDIRAKIQSSRWREDIVLPGYVSEAEKQHLLKGARVFLFPTLYEGFGIPVLEAQAAGVPVITSNTSSLPEVAGEGALLVDPLSVTDLAEAMRKLVSDEVLRTAIIEKAKKNLERFSWKKTAKALAQSFAGE